MKIRRPARPLLAVALLILAGASAACDADCRDMCKKVIRQCDYAEPGYGVDQCEAECQIQVDRAEESADADTESAAIQDQLNCIVDAECSALLDASDPAYPACYSSEADVF